MQGKKYRSKRSKLIYYANIMIVSSITLIVYGLVLYFTSGTNILTPIIDNNNINGNGDSTITISTNDGSQVVPGNTMQGTNKTGSLGGNTSSIIGGNGSSGGSLGNQVAPQTPTSPQTPIAPSGNTGSNNQSGGQVQQQQQPQQQVVPAVPTLEETNDTFRKNIQSTYGITVKYGGETDGYTVGGIGTTSIYDATVINNALNNLNNALAKYPKGFFDEMRRGGIPLTVLLINNYANPSITGITDSNYSFAHISIAVSHPFEESFYHESYHYIERYIFKRGGNFSSWDSLNPQGFVYNQNISNANSFANTHLSSAPFVNTYAQTAATEDRASTFEYMMAANKAICFEKDMPVWRKAYLMSSMIDAAFNSVSPNVIEYWERHL